MTVKLSGMWAVSYTNPLANKITTHAKLFKSREDAEEFGKNHAPKDYTVNPVFFDSND